VEKLLKAGADFEAMDNNGQTALDWARAYEGSKGDGVRLTIIALEKWEKSHT
jgi:ankyrin repeat protein